MKIDPNDQSTIAQYQRLTNSTGNAAKLINDIVNRPFSEMSRSLLAARHDLSEDSQKLLRIIILN